MSSGDGSYLVRIYLDEVARKGRALSSNNKSDPARVGIAGPLNFPFNPPHFGSAT